MLTHHRLTQDVGKSKSEVAAAFIRERCPWINITAHMGKIQDKPVEFYKVRVGGRSAPRAALKSISL